MTLNATIAIDVNAAKTATSGLTSSVEQHPLRISVDVGDCDEVWSDRGSIGSSGFIDINLATIGISTVKFLLIKNLSTKDIAFSAGWDGFEFRNLITPPLAWDFSPVLITGAATIQGLPIRAKGVYLLSCPNSSGYSTGIGGSRLRIGGQSGSSYEIYVLGN